MHWRTKPWLSAGLAVLVCLTSLLGMGNAPVRAAADESSTPAPAMEPASSAAAASYAAYRQAHAQAADAADTVSVSGQEVTARSEDTQIADDFRGSGAVCAVLTDTGYAEWSVDVPREGLYGITVRYLPADAAGGDVEAALTIDGASPFREVTPASFKRTYRQDATFPVNVAGNDVKPAVEEVYALQEAALRDATGYVAEPFRFFLTAGVHTLRLTGSRGSLAVAKITLHPVTASIPYGQYRKDHLAAGHGKPKASRTFVEGERFTYKNAITLQPVSDHSSPATSPQSAEVLKLNTVGGDNWKRVGDALTWTIDVEASGLYEIAPRFRQNLRDGIFTSRKLLIDGTLPFAEAGALRFGYSSDWQLAKLGDGETAYQFYLEAGEHTLTLEAVLGDVAEMTGQIQQSLNTLNALYRKIILVTGTSPDQYRDYHFETLIPDEIRQLGEERDRLQAAVETIDREAGGNGSYTSILKKIIFQLDQMATKPASIAKYLEQFKSNIGSLGTWLLSASEQPLQIDRIYLVPQGEGLPPAEAGFFSRLAFGARAFAATFVTDYSAIGQTAEAGGGKPLKVWVQTGRDQAEIVRQLIDTGFAKEQGASVTLELVAAGTLLQSVLAGLSPDVALSNPVAEPINYAVRNANLDLKQFPDFDEVAARFHPSAMVPYTYRGHVYALPETFSFYMFFYRTDIFAEMDLAVPESWNDLLGMIPALQRRNLSMGIPHDVNAYALLLYQNGGDLYAGEGERTNLDTNVGLNSFLDLTELFTLYSLPVAFDFANRFRSGEMPCAIVDYTMYNQLTVFAPEIKGQWRMVPVPGKAGEDGTVRHLSVGTGTGAMILRDARDPDLAWSFLKWWMSADVQSAFAVQMESVLGPAAKQATANMEALGRMTWSSQEYRQLLAQLEQVRAVPEVPGSYYLARVLSFAFNRVYNSSGTQNMAENPVEVLTDYIEEFNDELARKREEFGIR